MTRHKLFKHGGSRIDSSCQFSISEKEVAKHLKRFWELIPTADPQQFIKNISVFEEAAILEDSFPDQKPVVTLDSDPLWGRDKSSYVI